MSMWLVLNKVSTEALQELKSTPARIEERLEGESVDGFDLVVDRFATDFVALAQVRTALVADPASPVMIQEDDFFRYRAAARANFNDETSTLARASGAGFAREGDDDSNHFFLTAVQVREVAHALAREPWFAELSKVDDNANIPGLLRFYATAVGEGKAIIGVVA